MKFFIAFIFVWGLFFLSAPLKILSSLNFVISQTRIAEAATLKYPSALIIPSINLVASIQGVGTDIDGAMSVPTMPNTVGWFKDGTLPGEMGSAVFDAHVYLAFKNLKKIKIGDNMYVTAKNGTVARFLVSGIHSYSYKNVPLEELFALSDDKHLNLITCAGKWLPGQGTYDHRLVVYAKLVG